MNNSVKGAGETLEQLNVVGFTETLKIPQASLLPLFT
jgi:hypothetical protein